MTYLCAIEAVWVEDRLYHDKALGQVFPYKHVTVEGRLIWTVVEDLKELGSSQVEHELWGCKWVD